MQPMKKRKRAGHVFLLAFGVFWTAFSLLLTASGAGVFGLFFVAVGLALIGFGLAPMVAALKAEPPQVTMSRDAVRVGESFTVAYRQRFRRPVSGVRVRLEWLFRESATYRRGTDTFTDTHERMLGEWEHPGRAFSAGQEFVEEQTFAVPPDAMHTFAAPRNTLRYFVRVRVEMPGWPDVREEYEVRVPPQHVSQRKEK